MMPSLRVVLTPCRLLVACLCGLGALNAQGQLDSSRSAADGTPPAVLTPGSPAGAYSLGDFEEINLYNGHLNIAIPLLSIGGRGKAGYTMKASVSSPQWVTQIDIYHSCQDLSCGPPTWNTTAYDGWWNPLSSDRHYNPGFLLVKQNASGLVNCTPLDANPSYRYQDSFTQLVFTDANGTEHDLYSWTPGVFYGTAHNSCASIDPVSQRSLTFHAIDGSGLVFVGDGNSYYDRIHPSEYSDNSRPARSSNKRVGYPGSGTLYLPNGVLYHVDANGRIDYIQDPNGNRTSFQYASEGTQLTNLVSSVTDSLGRAVSIDNDYNDPQNGTIDRIKTSIDGVNLRTTWIKRDDYRSHLRPDYAGMSALLSLGGPSYVAANKIVAVHLPNGRSYQIYYSPYGEVARIDLPTGGRIEYDHAAGLANAGAVAGTYASGQVLDDLSGLDTNSWGGSGTPWTPVIYRRLVARRTYADTVSTTPISTTTYSLPETATGTTSYSNFGGRYGQAAISYQGYVEVSTSGVNVSPPVTERHYFYSTPDFCYGAQPCTLGGVDPAKSGPAPATGPLWSMLSTANYGAISTQSVFPDTFQGKEYMTIVPNLRTTERIWG